MPLGIAGCRYAGYLLPSYTLVGLDAVPEGVVVDGDQLRVVEPETGRTLHSVA